MNEINTLNPLNDYLCHFKHIEALEQIKFAP